MEPSVALISSIDMSSTPISNLPSAASTSSSDDDLKFTRFSKMALELRAMVWRNVCFQERVIDIWPVAAGMKFGSDEIEKRINRGGPPHYTYKSNAKRVPGILHTSQEARIYGLQHYSLAFGIEHFYRRPGGYIMDPIPPQIYVNWECDIICPMRDPAPFDSMPQASLFWDLEDLRKYPKMRRIAFGIEELCRGHSPDVSFYKGIEEVILYPRGYALLCLQDEMKWRVPGNLDMKMVDFDVDLHRSKYSAAGYPLRRDSLIQLEEEIHRTYFQCMDLECTMPHIVECAKRLRYPECVGPYVECKDLSHRFLKCPVSFKILTIKTIER